MTEIRALGAGDLDALQAFFARVPEGDRTFFKEDVTDREAVASWTTDARSRRLVARDDDAVVGYVAVIPGVGWSSHVGELRVVVDPETRGRGLGRALARQGLLAALDLGLRKVVVEVVADQQPAIGMFQALGFEAEALLKDHVCDRAGTLRDLIVLAHAVDATWSAMATAGIEDELAT